MKHLVAVIVALGLAGKVQAHVSDLPAMVHVAEHSWLVMTLVTLAAVVLPRWGRRR
jgi:uncharacterized membrane protein YjjB (DUF3815 family)